MDQRNLIALGAAVCFFMLAAPFCAAQEAPAPASEQEQKVAYKKPYFRFSFLGLEHMGNLCYLSYPQDPTLPPKIMPLRIPRQNLSSIYGYNGPRELQLYWMPETPDAPPVPAVKYRIPEGQQRRMFMLTDTGEKKDGKPVLELIDLDDTQKFAPAGSYQIINRSQIPVAGRVGKDTFNPFPAYVPPKKFSGKLDLDVYVYLQTENRIASTHRSSLNVSPENRYWLCIFPTGQGERRNVMVRIVKERLIAGEYVAPDYD